MLFLTGAACTAPFSVEISTLPYYHDPARAWKLTVRGDGTVVYSESDHLLKRKYPSADEWIPFTETDSPLPAHLSKRKLQLLKRQLEGLDLAGIKSSYSAEFCWPTGDLIPVRDQSGGIVEYWPGEACRSISHGTNYAVRVSGLKHDIEAIVYAPLAALDAQDPPHPDRADIRKLVAIWYYVLKQTGKVNGYKAKHFAAWRE